MKHLFVPYDIAVMARDLGFTSEMWFAWRFGDGSGKDNHYEVRQRLSELQVGIPTYEQLLDWFRIKHKRYINVEPSSTDGWFYNISIYSKDPYSAWYHEQGSGDYTWRTRKQARDIAIKKAFKLIKP